MDLDIPEHRYGMDTYDFLTTESSVAEHGLTERNDISIYRTESMVSVPTSGVNCRHEVQVKTVWSTVMV